MSGRWHARRRGPTSATVESGTLLSRRQLLTGAAAVAGSAIAPRVATGRTRQRARADDPLEALRGASASLLCDAMTRLGHDARAFTMSRAGVGPMFPVQGTVLGRAVTTKYELGGAQTTVDDIRRFVFDPVDQAEDGAVWVTASGTDEVLSMFGDIIVLACERQGLAGLVTDGGCRDLDPMERLGVPVFARGTCLYGPSGVIRPVAANVPIVCGGVKVVPGDVIAADVDGVLVIPSAAVPEVARLRAELDRKEEETRRLIEEGGSLRASYLV